jgi:hypothetical protein
MKTPTNTTAHFTETIELDVPNTPTQLNASELETVIGAPDLDNDPPPR